jgi:hypothetical protein
MATGRADAVIDLRERLAPFVEIDLDAPEEEALELEDRPPDPLLTGPTMRVRPLRARPYEPRHLAT